MICMTDNIRCTLPAVADSVPEARRLVTSLAADVSASEEQVDSVGLAVSEAVTNAVMYAYELRDGKIHLAATVDSRQLSVRVADDGCGLGNSSAEGGLGLGLVVIEQLSESLTIARRASGGVELRMSFALGPTAA
jgi:anti-sigma regulatory factor (Ser/Thr protein kinase)